MSFSIEGKTAVVTGAANGVGLAVARHFAERGANVMFADMDEARLEEEVGDLNDDENSGVAYYAGDLREKLNVANLLSATIDRFDRADILVNASRQMLSSDPLNPDDDLVTELLNQNLMTSLRLSQISRQGYHAINDLDPGRLLVATLAVLVVIPAVLEFHLHIFQG